MDILSITKIDQLVFKFQSITMIITLKLKQSPWRPPPLQVYFYLDKGTYLPLLGTYVPSVPEPAWDMGTTGPYPTPGDTSLRNGNLLLEAYFRKKEGAMSGTTWVYIMLGLYIVYCFYWGLKGYFTEKTSAGYAIAGRSIPFIAFLMAATAA